MYARYLLTTLACLAVALCSGCLCAPLWLMPDQEQFEDIEELANCEQAVVRMYGGPVNMLECIGIHVFFMIKPKGVYEFERWEKTVALTEPGGYIQSNFPDIYTGFAKDYVIAELQGPEAEPIIDFIINESINYPFKYCYAAIGPNSNTYPQWVIEQTGWDVYLPPTAVGWHATGPFYDWFADCDDRETSVIWK